MKKNELYVMTICKDLSKYVITVTEGAPKKFRFTLVQRLQNYTLDIIENIHYANSYNVRDDLRIKHQLEAKRKLSVLDYYAGLSYEVQCIKFKHYEEISKQIANALMYLNKWIASDKKSIN